MNEVVRPRVRRGVSLIEAIVAMAVMAFGLVAIVGLQATLRGNADVSRQRAEAVRVAQEEIERWRAFVSLQAVAGVDFTDIATSTDQFSGLNATYTITRVVPDQVAPGPKTVQVRVSWNDRSGLPQWVSLNTAIAGIAPELAGTLVLPQHSGATQRVNNRNPLIPRTAKNFGDGTSGFVPPQSGNGPKVVWVFNNGNGLIERFCTVDANTSTDTLALQSLADCNSSVTAQLISGYVNFAGPPIQAEGPVSESEAELPTGVPLNLDMQLTLTSPDHPSPGSVCFDDSPQTPEALARPVVYFCAIYANSSRTWSGRLRVNPLGFGTGSDNPSWTIGTGSQDLQVCRYTVLPNDGVASSKNSAHPLDYTAQGSAPGASMRDQNFLVIRGVQACPSDALSSTDPVNSNTRVHQNGVDPYI